MENLLVSSVVKPLLGTLTSMAVDKIAIAWGVKAELESMASMLSAIQDVLQEAEQRQWKNSLVRGWLGKLKDVAFDADDVIDEFVTEAAIWKVRSERGALRRAGKYFLLPKRLVFRLNIGEKVKDVNRKLADLDKEKNIFEFIPRVEIAVRPFPESRITTSAAVASKLYGQDDDRQKVIHVLLKNLKEKGEDLLVYAIYGMGGLGKTTLAKTVFHDSRVGDFKLKIWVCVSENFDISRLIRAILESVDGCACSLEEKESLQLDLKKKLSGKEFLLILDDVWNEDETKWEEFKSILMSSGAKGSAVIVTTRTKKIAALMAPTCYTHRLSSLSDDDSWSLFEQRAAIGGHKREEYMERIGKALLIKCCGVPLAINALGSLMRSKNGEDEWRSVMESEIWGEGNETVLSALGVSFYHLSSRLRQCFTYCCVFPKDYELEKDELIQLWMANGFIPSDSKTKWYVFGARVFNELVSRGFIQDVEERRGYTRGKIHHLMHDLALSIMRDDSLNAENGTRLEVSVRLRHYFFKVGSNFEEQMAVSTKFHSLRSFLEDDDKWWVEEHVDLEFVSRLKHLRALKARFVDQRSLSQLSRLAHLRYLNLSRSEIKVLPESIAYLQNLQSLNLRFCSKLSKLPRNLKYIKSLRFLNIRYCFALENMPDMEQLGSQQIMVDGLKMKLGKSDCKITHVREINVSGLLELDQLQHVRDPQDARHADLKSKSSVRSLVLMWETDDSDDNDAVDRVTDALQPHPNLTKLYFVNCPRSKFPVWLDDLYLGNLQLLELEDCKRWEFLPPIGKLPFLESLRIKSMPLVKYFVGTDMEEMKSYNDQMGDLFPALECLFLHDMPSLVAWTAPAMNQKEICRPTDLVMFKCLKDLILSDCENLVSQPPIAIATGVGGDAMKGCSGMSSSLEELDVDNYRQLVSLSKGLTALKKLSLQGLLDKDTPWEGLQHLSSVSELSVSFCDKLTYLPVFLLTTFNSLSHLTIKYCINLTLWSERKEGKENSLCFGSLLSLEISSCEKLSALPDCLDTLEYFEVDSCPKLTSLPDGLLNNNTSLQDFRVSGCPELEKRCRSKGTGGYWSHISHIPFIIIGGEIVQYPKA